MYSVIWPQLRPDGWAGVEHAFASMTRMSIADYFTIGSTVMARLVNFANSGQGAPMIAPETYFAASHVDPSVPQAFFAFTARDVDANRGVKPRRSERGVAHPTIQGDIGESAIAVVADRHVHRLVPRRARGA